MRNAEGNLTQTDRRGERNVTMSTEIGVIWPRNARSHQSWKTQGIDCTLEHSEGVYTGHHLDLGIVKFWTLEL